ncbi:MAG: MBL fold metallo-hydrolase, partial [Archaeoglobaceae archaeon]
MKVFENVFAYVWGKAFADCSNTYLLKFDTDVIVIDPGRLKAYHNLLGLMRRDGFQPRNVEIVVNTHLHLDHFEANVMFKRHGSLLAFFDESRSPDLSVYELCDYGIEVIHAPGHSADSVVLYLPEQEAAITGDLIFENGIPGRTDLPSGDARMMIKSLMRVQSLDAKYILPGHGRLMEGREGIRLLFDKAIILV